MSNQQTVREIESGFECTTCGKVLSTKFAAIGHVNLSHRGVRPHNRTLPVEITTSRWSFKGNGTDKNFTSYLEKNLSVGLEMEYDFKNSRRPVDNDQLNTDFGVYPTSYHRVPDCPTCGESNCWKHIPVNLVRAIERDSSINGYEFIIYGNNLDSEEFAERIPLEKIKQNFKVTNRDSMHIHILLVNQVQDIPTLILKNFWQLFRFYYPAWVNLFGNSPRTYLRNNSFTGFDNFRVSPVLNRNFSQLIGGNRSKGISLKNVETVRNNVRHLDVEIRTNDASMCIEQIVMARALAKALFIRAAQLSNYGIINVDKNEVTWKKVKEITEKLNLQNTDMEIDENFFHDLTKSLLSEVSQFLSKYEKECYQSLMNEPVRTRRGFVSRVVAKRPVSETAKIIKRVIVSITEAESEADWITKISRSIGKTEQQVSIAIKEIDAYWDEDIKAMVMK